MLTIREEQMQSFREALAADFRRRLSAHIRTLRPEPSDAEIDKLSDNVMTECGTYSIEREVDIARYATIVLKGSPTPLSKKAKNILLQHGVPAEERLTQLEGHLAAAGGK